MCMSPQLVYMVHTRHCIKTGTVSIKLACYIIKVIVVYGTVFFEINCHITLILLHIL